MKEEEVIGEDSVHRDDLEEYLRFLLNTLDEGGFKITIHAERIPEEDK